MLALYDGTTSVCAIKVRLTLAASSWLAGPSYSLADAAATPYINRLSNLGLLDVMAETRPRVLDWFARVRERPSFKAAVTDYFTAKDAEHLAGITKDAPDRVRAILAASRHTSLPNAGPMR